MPIRKCSNGKYRIGSGDCVYTSKASAEHAYAGYRAAKYSEGTLRLRENTHSPSFTYGNLVSLINQIRSADPREEQSQRLDAAFNSNDTIVFLGALGAAEIPGWVDFGYAGGDVDSPIPDFAADPNISPNVGGYHEPWSGAVRLPVNRYLNLMQGRPTIDDANAVVHEIMHRGIAMLFRLTNSYDELQAMLPNDLFTHWAGGWGLIDPVRYPARDVIDRHGDLHRDMQVNPEHAMIYAMTSTPNSYFDRVFVQSLGQFEWASRFFNTNWHASFNDRYDDLTRDRPTDDIRRMRTYWRILYYNTERGLSRFLRRVLAMPPNLVSSPRPQTRPTAADPQNDAQGHTMADLLGIVPANTFSPLSAQQRESLLIRNTAQATRNSAQLFRGKTVRLANGQEIQGQVFHDNFMVGAIQRGDWRLIESFLNDIEIR